jgi:hypothetical protein
MSEEIIRQALELARQAAQEQRFIAGSWVHRQMLKPWPLEEQTRLLLMPNRARFLTQAGVDFR